MVLKGASEMPKQSPKTDSQDRGRFSARRKTEAVLRLLRGEDLDTLSRELGVAAAALSSWRAAFLDGGTAAMKSRTGHRPRWASTKSYLMTTPWRRRPSLFS